MPARESEGPCDTPNLTITFSAQADLLLARGLAGASKAELVTKHLPLWMACELMTFGGMFTLYRGLAKPLQQALAGQFGVADTVFESWLRALNQARNLCAHHARVWNRVFGLRPQIPRANKHPQWHQPVAIRDDRIFGLLSVLRYLLRQTAPASAWSEQLKAVLAAYPGIPLADMGFPVGWEQSPIWH